MRSNSLRAEFVLSGAALLVGIGALVVAIDLCTYGDGHPLIGWATGGVSSAEAVLLLAAAVGVAYALGAVIVQLTFDRHILPERGGMRDARITSLRELDEQLHLGPEKATATGRLHEALWGKTIPLNPTTRDAAMTLAVTAGQAAAGGEVAREYEYHRAYRQLFLGVRPALWVFALAVPVAMASLHAALALTGVISVLSARYFAKRLLTAALWQDEKAQQLLVDMAFIRGSALGVDTPSASEP